jgi:hypothetical protein
MFKQFLLLILRRVYKMGKLSLVYLAELIRYPSVWLPVASISSSISSLSGLTEKVLLAILLPVCPSSS